MSDVAIRVENIGKKYTLGTGQQGGMYGYKSLRDAIAWRMGMLKEKLSFKRHESQLDAAISDEFWALKDVSFEVNQGDVVGIIGRNGSGKSTLLKILSRITEPTEGSVQLHGRVGSLLEVGTGFHPELTGRENIYMNGAILGMRKTEIDRKFDEIVAFAETEKFLDTPVKRYSSGMYVRLAFAVAAHLEPEILLVDEVLAVGDAAFQKKCLGKMGEVAKGGRTVLFVSHDMGAIANFCSRVLCVDGGNLLYDGLPREVITEYLQNNLSLHGEMSWENSGNSPGNNMVQLHAVRIVSNDIITSDPPIDSDLYIEIEYEILKEGTIFDVAIHLRDNMQKFVLATSNCPSMNTIVDEFYGKLRHVGRYRTVCKIPGNFLNNLTYSIDVGFSSNGAWIFNEENIITFKMFETGAMKQEYSGDWVGVIRPKLAWMTEIL